MAVYISDAGSCREPDRPSQTAATGLLVEATAPFSTMYRGGAPARSPPAMKATSPVRPDSPRCASDSDRPRPPPSAWSSAMRAARTAS